jgi:hypothetical protein
MSYKDDFSEHLKRIGRKGRRILFPRDCTNRTFRYIPPRQKTKPDLFDPNAKDGPVKVYTPEEIKEYEEALKQKKKGSV